jgi:hypothetical protein
MRQQLGREGQQMNRRWTAFLGASTFLALGCGSTPQPVSYTGQATITTTKTTTVSGSSNSSTETITDNASEATIAIEYGKAQDSETQVVLLGAPIGPISSELTKDGQLLEGSLLQETVTDTSSDNTDPTETTSSTTSNISNFDGTVSSGTLNISFVVTQTTSTTSNVAGNPPGPTVSATINYRFEGTTQQ